MRKEWLYVDITIVARKGHKLWEDIGRTFGKSVLDISSIETTSARLQTQTQERAEIPELYGILLVGLG